ncbi:choice-of-anchor M domain-containing protein [Corynebacterium cystitidis]|uniref:choice-of-anchor M domain-containing protein n=1 Tax=Corynebacterium cystitidis TaxID=35757 RepID=UPI00211E4492|nr:choice-of-anchor M domain-containing protein [Corynebacterium cystitidis]
MKKRHLHLIATTTALSLLGGVLVASPVHAGPDDGKTITTQGHVDAPKTFFNFDSNTFELKNEFQENNYPLEETAVWIGKGWSDKGNNQYQFNVTDDELLDFLAEDGEVLYASPAFTSGGHNPVWLGFGADANIPADDFRDGTIVLDILDIEGPGKVEMFSYTNDGDWKNLRRLMSSSDEGFRSARLNVGQHTHNWTTFTQPGRYVLTYQSSARDKQGNLISSGPQKLAIQVGGLKPVDHETPSLQQRYDDAHPGDASQQNYSLNIAPKANPEKDGDEHLSTITFDSGDPTVNGTLTLLNHGYFLTDIEVENGTASYDELLAAGEASIQAVFTPEGDNPRWISQPVAVARGGTASTTSQNDASTIQDKRQIPGHTPLSQEVHTPSDTSVEVTMVADPHDSDYTLATLSFADPKIRGFIEGGVYASAHASVAEYPLQMTVNNGKATIRFQDGGDYEGYTPKFTFYPHPNTRVTSAEIIPGEWNAKELTYSTTLEESADQQSPVAPQPSNPAPQDPQPDTPNQTGVTLPADTQVVTTGEYTITGEWDDNFKVHTYLREGTDGPDHVPGTITLGVQDSQLASRESKDEAAAFDFLQSPGPDFYLLPEDSTTSPTLGYTTSGFDYHDFTDQGLALHVTPVSTPVGAQWGAYHASGVVLDSTSTTAIETTERTDDKLNWVFTQPGIYEFEIQYRAHYAGGSHPEEFPTKFKKETLRFAVSDATIGGAASNNSSGSQPTTPNQGSDTPQPGDVQQPSVPLVTGDAVATSGAVNITANYQDGALTTTLVKDSEEVTSPGSLAIGVNDASLTTRSGEYNQEKFDFMGPRGGQYYNLPHDPVNNLPLVGYNTYNLNYNDFLEREVNLVLTPRQIPEGASWGVHEFSWNTGQVVHASSVTEDYSIGTVSDFFTRDTPLAWSFSKPGRYVFDVTFQAKDPDGTPVASEPMPLTFAVGNAAINEFQANPGITPPSHEPTPTPTPQPSVPGSQDQGDDKNTASLIALDRGHVDIAVEREGDKFVAVLLDDTNLVKRGRQRQDLDTIALVARDNALQTRSNRWANEKFNFMGQVGEKFYLLPQQQNPHIIWPGYNTQSLNYADYTEEGGNLVLRPKNVPADASWGVFLTDGFGGSDVLIDSTTGDHTISTDFASHTHVNWAFSDPGVYQFDLTYEATLIDGTTITSEPETLTFALGDKAITTVTTPGASLDPGTAKPAPTPVEPDPTPADPAPAPAPAPAEPPAEPAPAEPDPTDKDDDKRQPQPSNTWFVPLVVGSIPGISATVIGVLAAGFILQNLGGIGAFFGFK